jgi:ubiquinone/menaquinone biosynthesis C-methylase UbiE
MTSATESPQMHAPPEEVKRYLSGLFDRAATTYESVGVPFFGPLGRRLVQVAAVQPGWRILDVGCGRGAALVPAAEAVGPQGEVVGIDIAPGMVGASLATAARRGLDNVRVLQMDAERPDPALGEFDAIVAGFVVPLLPDPAAALRRYEALLRPGGRFAMSSWAGRDARWSVLEPVYARFRTDRSARFEEIDRLWEDTAWVEALVAGAGFTGAHSEQHVHRSRFRNADHFWEWEWSHGGRAVWEEVPRELQDEARAALRTALATIAEPDGSLLLHSPARYTVARSMIVKDPPGPDREDPS